MLFKIPKEIFPTEIYLVTFFSVQKGPIENDRLKIPASATFIGVQGSLGWWRNKIARPGCLDAILVFLLKTTSLESWPAEAIAMSI